MSSRATKILVPIVILLGAAFTAALMASARKAPARQERQIPGPLVDVIKVTAGDVRVDVRGHGEVGAKVAVDVVPQVSGQVIELHPSLVAGGFFKAGEALVVIDPRDYELAVERAMASLARARVTLETERAEAEVARQEWQELHPGEEPPSGLVVREPQVRQAEAELEAARADLDVAKLALERTRVSVPFDGVVVSESADPGQFVAVGQSIARVYGTEVVEVRLPIEDRELAWFTVPNGLGQRAPEADVRATFAGRDHVWKGRVVRLEAEVDASTRMVHVVVEVPRPYDRSHQRPALLPGTFVEVTIHGRTLSNVISVPRYAVHEGGTVLVVHDGRLQIRQVELARSDRLQAYVISGLESGEQVVVSALDAVTDGMKVRTAEEEPATESVNDGDTTAAVGSGLQVPAHSAQPGLQADRIGRLPRGASNRQPATNNLQPMPRGAA